ncbi:MAG: PAS domain-containing protein [Alphaproteobacteria bacterium]|nr:PAS domain-containing protein [Alphaproteobacteria bacterium]
MAYSSPDQAAALTIWQALFDALPAAVALLDAGGRVVAVNRVWEKVIGPFDRAAIARDPRETYARMGVRKGLWDDAVAQRLETALSDVVAERIDSYNDEVPVTMGEVLWHRVGIVPLDRNSFDGAVAIHLDVTEQRRMRLELVEQAQILENANRELRQFTYVASHDLQEPLRTVVSYLQLLTRRCQGRLDEEATTFVGFAVDGARRMSSLIQDLLSYSRISSAVPKMEAVALEDCAEDVRRALHAAIEDAGAELRVDSLPVVHADPVQMRSLLQNLLSNALKYHQPGVPPVVTISARRLEAAWEIAVADNGIGIDPEYQGRIFEMFTRLHPIGTFEGTGIGLAIARRVVELHGGTLRVDSAEGRGSTFLFTLPAP